MEFRVEKDSMGEVKVPTSALYGAQTQRAVDNFPISGIPMPKSFVRALAFIKAAAARANRDLGLLDEEKAISHRKSGSENRRRALLHSVPD